MLLDDIVELATNDNQSITVMLRKCIVLAHQIKNERLKIWANMELNGYKNDDQLPDYRVISAHAHGDFYGFVGSHLKNHIIPPAVLEEEHRDYAESVRLVQAVAAYEEVVKTAKSDAKLIVAWPPNLVLYYQNRIKFNVQMKLFAASQDIPKASLVEVLDTIRNRVLNVALEVQSEVGNSDDALKHITPAAGAQIEKVVSQQIFNGNVYFASGQASMNVQQQNITVGDWNELEQVLRSSGISQPEINELSSAVAQDHNKMGSSVTAWIQKTAPKVLSSGVKMAQEVGQGILTEYLKKHFGLS